VYLAVVPRSLEVLRQESAAGDLVHVAVVDVSLSMPRIGGETFPLTMRFAKRS